MRDAVEETRTVVRTRVVVRGEEKPGGSFEGGPSPLSTGPRGPATVLSVEALAPLRRKLKTHMHKSISSTRQCHQWNKSGSLSPARRVDPEADSVRSRSRPTRLLLTCARRPPYDSGRSRRRLRLPTGLDTFRALLASTSVGRGRGMLKSPNIWNERLGEETESVCVCVSENE